MPDYSHIEVIQLLKKLVSIESTNVGSYEKEIGDFIYHWLETETAGTGVSLLRDEALPGRYNIVAELKGEIERPNFVWIRSLWGMVGRRIRSKVRSSTVSFTAGALLT